MVFRDILEFLEFLDFMELFLEVDQQSFETTKQFRETTKNICETTNFCETTKNVCEATRQASNKNRKTEYNKLWDNKLLIQDMNRAILGVRVEQLFQICWKWDNRQIFWDTQNLRQPKKESGV